VRRPVRQEAVLRGDRKRDRCPPVLLQRRGARLAGHGRVAVPRPGRHDPHPDQRHHRMRGAMPAEDQAGTRSRLARVAGRGAWLIHDCRRRRPARRTGRARAEAAPAAPRPVATRLLLAPRTALVLVALCALSGCGLFAAPCRVASAGLKIVPIVGQVAAAPTDGCANVIDPTPTKS